MVRWVMQLHKTTPDQRLKVSQIATDMNAAELDSSFVADCVELANEYEGTHDLMVLWNEATSQNEKDEIVADLQGEIAAHRDR